VKVVIYFQHTCLRKPRCTIKRADRLFVLRNSVHVYYRVTRTDRPVCSLSVCLSPCHNPTSILHFTVKRFLLSCPQIDRLHLGDRPTNSLHCNSENTPRHVSTKRYSKNRPNVSCPAAVLPSVERSPNPLNPLHYVSLLN
jgi:hypothetical protein